MSRPVYTSQVCSFHNFSGDAEIWNSSTDLLVIRDISWWVAAPLTDSGDQFVYLNAGAGHTTVDWFTVDVDTTVMHHVELRIAVPPDTSVVIHGDLAGDVTITGYVLTLP